jgi:hypothetical protein
MNLVAIIVLFIGMILASEIKSDDDESMKSLCIISNGKCVQDAGRNNYRMIEQLEGFFCLDEPDFKKIVDTLKKNESE